MAPPQLMRATEVYDVITRRIQAAGTLAIARRMDLPASTVAAFLSGGAAKASPSDLIHFGHAVGVEIIPVDEPPLA